MSDEPDLLFVYGTLRKDANHPSHRLLENGTTGIGRGHINGRLYEINGYPGAVRSDNGEEQVFGELYRLRKTDSLLARLDDYEEAGDKYPEPQEYRRDLVTVTREDKTKVIAWCYLYNRPTTGLRQVTSGDWCEGVEDK